MTKLLIKLFIKDSGDGRMTAKLREKYGVLSGCVGIVLNILLAVAKLIVGTIANSISITADAVNNFSDVGSSAVSLIGFKASSKAPDKEHPFGHGRIEYIAALVVSFIILSCGLELIKTSIDKIMHPETVVFSYPAAAVLVLSILGKLWLALFNNKIAKRISSVSNKAVVADSLSDIISTTATLIALICARFTSLPVDGYMGIIVAAFIILTGISVVRDTISPLLGERPDPELVKEIEQEILSHEGITGVHDLMVHSYGPSRVFVSAHAEVPADVDINVSHDVVDNVERALKEKYGILASIHMDPIVTNDAHIAELRQKLGWIVKQIDPELSIHDLRVVDGPTHSNLIFDLVVPYKYKIPPATLSEMVTREVKKLSPTYNTVITVENSYI